MMPTTVMDDTLNVGTKPVVAPRHEPGAYIPMLHVEHAGVAVTAL
jgi:hypothetical protein